MATPARETRFDPALEPPMTSREFGLIDLQRTLISRANLLWLNRRTLVRASAVGLLLGIVLAILIPSQYESSVELMPPDNQSGQGLAMVAALAGGAGGLGSVAGDLLGLKSTSDQFVGILHSRAA